MPKKDKSGDDYSGDNMSSIGDTPIDAPIADPVPVDPPLSSDHYEGKQHYPKVLYHSDHAARKVSSPEEHAALEQEVAGWTEAPAPVETPEAPKELPGVKA